MIVILQNKSSEHSEYNWNSLVKYVNYMTYFERYWSFILTHFLHIQKWKWDTEVLHFRDRKDLHDILVHLYECCWFVNYNMSLIKKNGNIYMSKTPVIFQRIPYFNVTSKGDNNYFGLFQLKCSSQPWQLNNGKHVLQKRWPAYRKQQMCMQVCVLTFRKHV